MSSPEFPYMLLDRLRNDCEYVINTCANESRLWADNVADQISNMRELYDEVPEKPEWITLEDIDRYEVLLGEAVK